jgi:methyl-accepting chemotaxis protein
MAAGAEQVTGTLTAVSEDVERSAEGVERARTAARELNSLSPQLTELVGSSRSEY